MHRDTKTIFLIVLSLISTISHAYDFKINEQLGRDWTNEFVTFPLNSKQHTIVKNKPVLIGSDGKAVPWQLVSDGNGEPRIGFQVYLEKNSGRSWEFSSQVSQNSKISDLKIENTDEMIRISNSHTGISIAKHQKNDSGLISGVMLNSGKWIGRSHLIADTPISSWKVEITESGPVMAEITAIVVFGNKGIWETRFRMFNNEPVVLIDELFLVKAQVKHDIDLSENFNPTELFYRYGKGMPDGKVGKNISWTIKPGRVC